MRIISRLRSIFRRALRHLAPQNIIKTHTKDKSRKPHKLHQSHIHVNSINKIILSMVNKERRKRHLHPIIYDHDLKLHAVRWSQHMAHQKRLSHSGTILENACMVSGTGSPSTITKAMFNCWKKSKPHWNWMMNKRISKAGFGYTVRDKYAYGAYAFNDPQ